MAKKIFIITGDYSADVHAASVVNELKKNDPDIIVEAVGDINLQNAGVKLLFDHKSMGKMGLTFKSIMEHFQIGKRIVEYLKNDFKPDLVLLIDYGAFNLQISKALKKEGFKIYYFIPPQIWASRKYRLKTIKKNIDKVLTIFPFEKKFYEDENIACNYVGHPLAYEIKKCDNKEKFFIDNNLDLNKKLVSIFPGSRMFEIKFLLKIFLGAVKIIEKQRSDVQFVFCHAKNLSNDAFKVPYKTIKGSNHELLAYSDALILASGTVALEAAMYETPMLIAYRGPIFFYLVYLLVRNIKKACLVNIITNQDYVDEFLMFDATKEKIASGLIELLDNKDKINRQKEGLRRTKALLKEKNCINEVVYELENALKN